MSTNHHNDEFSETRIRENDFNDWLSAFKKKLDDQDIDKKKEIKIGASKLEKLGVKKERICSQLSSELEGRISDRYIREVLGDDYKDQRKVREKEICGTVPQNKEPVMITNDGQTVTSDSPDQSNPINDIYNGKSEEQMRREAQKETQEDKDETLENPDNVPPLTPTNIPVVPLLSDKSPEYRELEARYIEEKQIAEEQTALAKKNGADLFNAKRALIASKSGALLDEIKRLKLENSNLKTQYSEVDKEALAKEGYKEVEVFKLEQGTLRMLQEISAKSQRTFFLLVHPKTMQIKGAKTDVQMHQIQAKRAAGIE